MITLAGYQAETHKVVTPDGYILTLYRLQISTEMRLTRFVSKDCGKWPCGLHATRPGGQLCCMVWPMLFVHALAHPYVHAHCSPSPSCSCSCSAHAHAAQIQGASRSRSWSSGFPSSCRGFNYHEKLTHIETKKFS